MAKVARMYYGLGIRQQEITGRLNLHQSTISRLLKRAREANIVRISVNMPSGIFHDLEESLEKKYKLSEAIVVDCLPDEQQMVKDLGSAAAFYMESTIKEREIVGISSWSRNLLAMVDALHPTKRGNGGKVVQILGGMGNPAAQSHAASLTLRLANLIGATAVLLPAPGIVGSPEARKVLEKDIYVQQVLSLFQNIDTALVGIGSLQPSKLLVSSGNTFSQNEIEQLRASGAVGDICLRFFGADGQLVSTPLHNRVIGMEMETLRSVRRVVGVAGGSQKEAAIRGALRGSWINVLITDRQTAERLLDDDQTADMGVAPPQKRTKKDPGDKRSKSSRTQV
ncbi:MAG TPA: sugar-binding transcriptional regulator [Terriglobales bacterium]|nr:sugar-binding transcriptional regulator [Terriglobales bacterium]